MKDTKKPEPRILVTRATRKALKDHSFFLGLSMKDLLSSVSKLPLETLKKLLK